MKEISRRSFLKGALATTATAAVAGVVGIPAALAEGIYKPGTYTATANGKIAEEGDGVMIFRNAADYIAENF